MKNPERMLGVFNKRNKARLLPYARIISQVEGYDLSLSAPLAHSSYHRLPRLVKHESALFRFLVRKKFRNGRPPKSFKTVALARASIV